MLLHTQLGAGNQLPGGGTIFLSLRDADKEAGESVARGLVGLGFSILATHGTAEHLRHS